VTGRLAASALLLIAIAAGADGAASAQGLAPLDTSRSPPFTATLSNTTPLVIGMNAIEATQALGAELKYLSAVPATKSFSPSAMSAAAGCSRTRTGSICNSARAGSPAGRAIGAITGCGNDRTATEGYYTRADEGVERPAVQNQRSLTSTVSPGLTVVPSGTTTRDEPALSVWVSVTVSRRARGEKPPAIATALSTVMFGT